MYRKLYLSLRAQMQERHRKDQVFYFRLMMITVFAVILILLLVNPGCGAPNYICESIKQAEAAQAEAPKQPVNVLRQEVQDMVEFAEAASKANKDAILLSHYEHLFKTLAKTKKGEPAFSWHVWYHDLDVQGRALRLFIDNNSCFWKIDNIYVHESDAKLLVTPRSVQEILKC